jgi:hypothetical protein
LARGCYGSRHRTAQILAVAWGCHMKSDEPQRCSGGDRTRCRSLEIVSRPTERAVSAFTRWNALSLIRRLIARSFQRYNYSRSNYPSHPHSRNGHVAASIQRSSEWSALSSTHPDRARSEKGLWGTCRRGGSHPDIHARKRLTMTRNNSVLISSPLVRKRGKPRPIHSRNA